MKYTILVFIACLLAPALFGQNKEIDSLQHATGLSLSLSYDIIKAHGGELRVETVESEGAEFIILLPLK